MRHQYAVSLFLFVGFLLISATEVKAQAFTLSGGNQALNVNSAVAGSEPTQATNTTCSLKYQQRLFYTTKVTVQTSCPGQKFTIQVIAISVSKGTPAPAVSLQNGMAATDFITNVPTGLLTYGTATLQYTAQPLFSQGAGTDTHTVTYTNLVQ
jgi:hypothetical protein